MVATSHPLAVEAGLEALAAGGTAADAAVAAASTLCVVDPRSTGIGGDAFALYWPPSENGPVGLAAAGPAPAGLTLEALREAGHENMPTLGPWSITVPGGVAGWEVLLGRFGKLGLDRALRAAIQHTESGFTLTPVVAEEWASTRDKLVTNRAAAELFAPGGRTPATGQRFSNPELGRVLRTIASKGAGTFYRGEPAERIGAAVEAAGGPLRASDLADWKGPAWEDPIRATFGDVTVFESPPPGQGIVVLEALGIYGVLAPEDPVDREHASIEALKLAFADAREYVADPFVRPVPVEALLSASYLEERAGRVSMGRAREGGAGRPTDTVFVATADEDGAICSFIQSLYDGFGSAVGVPGTGIVLQNRARGFVLREGHPNRPEPGKRPYHTIIPAMLARSGGAYGALGIVGGFMQPQGQLQILRALVEAGMGPQEAIDRPRFRHLDGRRVGFEATFDADVVASLEARGHEVSELSRFEAGGAQVIVRTGERYVGGSDRRKDGVARGF